MNMDHDLQRGSALLPQTFQSDLPQLQLLQQHNLPWDHSVTLLLLTASHRVRAHGRQWILIILEGSCLLNVSLLPRFTGISNTIKGVWMSPSQELVNHFFCSSRWAYHKRRRLEWILWHEFKQTIPANILIKDRRYQIKWICENIHWGGKKCQERTQGAHFLMRSQALCFSCSLQQMLRPWKKNLPSLLLPHFFVSHKN